MKTKYIHTVLILWLWLPILLCAPDSAHAKAGRSALPLEDVVKRALKVSHDLKIAGEGVKASEASVNASIARFFPTVSGSYQYKRNEREKISPLYSSFKEEYTFAASVSQPVFEGFGIVNGYRLAERGLDVSRLNMEATTAFVVFDAKNKFFSVLKAMKLRNVAAEAVKMLETHKGDTEKFYRVGMIPMNDLLKADVELANSQQKFVMAENNFTVAKAAFNILLARPLGDPVRLADTETYVPFAETFDQCMKRVRKLRPEIKIADKEIEAAGLKMQLAQRDLFPSVRVAGNYYRFGREWDMQKTLERPDPDEWDVTATATWKLWDWGETWFKRREKKHEMAAARARGKKTMNSIVLEVKAAFLRVKAAERNISTAKRSVEQAQENFRISNERYREQVSTSTDVLDARTLLSEAETNYYTALYDFNISRAHLDRVTGVPHR